MLEPVNFIVLSSDGASEYQVSIRLDADRIICTCDCPAGRYGKMCKHKMSILSGNGGALANGAQIDQLRSISTSFADGNIGRCLHELSKAETALAMAKKSLDAAKAKLERLIRE